MNALFPSLPLPLVRLRVASFIFSHAPLLTNERSEGSTTADWLWTGSLSPLRVSPVLTGLQGVLPQHLCNHFDVRAGSGKRLSVCAGSSVVGEQLERERESERRAVIMQMYRD